MERTDPFYSTYLPSSHYSCSPLPPTNIPTTTLCAPYLCLPPLPLFCPFYYLFFPTFFPTLSRKEEEAGGGGGRKKTAFSYSFHTCYTLLFPHPYPTSLDRFRHSSIVFIAWILSLLILTQFVVIILLPYSISTKFYFRFSFYLFVHFHCISVSHLLLV